MAADQYSLSPEQGSIAAEVNPERTRNNMWCEALALCCSIIRAQKGISIDKFAARINVSCDDLLSFEMGHVCLRDPLPAIAEALGFPDLRAYFVAADSMMADPTPSSLRP